MFIISLLKQYMKPKIYKRKYLIIQLYKSLNLLEVKEMIKKVRIKSQTIKKYLQCKLQANTFLQWGTW